MLIFLDFCVVFRLSRSVSSVHNVASVSDRQFLIALSVFTNVYIPKAFS